MTTLKKFPPSTTSPAITTVTNQTHVDRGSNKNFQDEDYLSLVNENSMLKNEITEITDTYQKQM